MGSFLSCLREHEPGDAKRQPLLPHSSTIEEGITTSATQSAGARPLIDSRTPPCVDAPSLAAPIESAPNATQDIPPQISPTPVVAATQSSALPEISSSQPASSSSATAVTSSFPNAQVNQMLAGYDAPLVSSTSLTAHRSNPIDALGVALRSGFDGLQAEMQRNRGEVALMRGDISTLATHARGTATRDRERSFIERLPLAPDASYDELQGCMENTRTGIIGEGVDFLTREDVGETRVFLLTGCAGAGKTVIAHSIAHICHEEHDSLGASFIFQAGRESRDSPKYFVTTVARELSARNSEFSSRLSDAVEANPSIIQAALAKQFQILLLHPASTVTSQSRPIAIVIDAIDEGWAEPLLHVIKSFSKLPTWIRIFITLRDNGFILPRLRSQPHIIQREIDLKNEQNAHDIQVYIRERLREISIDRGLLDWPSDDVIENMCSMADGLFVWAAVACNSIADIDIDPIEQYEELVAGGSLRDTRAAPQMDQLYLKVLSKCRLDEPRALFRFRQCLGAIIVLRRPLPIPAHNELLGINHARHTLQPISPILNNLGDPKQTQPIQIIHQSLREFLTQGTSNGSPTTNCSIVESEHNENLAVHCLDLIRKTMPSLAEHTKWITALSEEARDIPTLPDGIVSDALWYACEFLVDHVRSVTREIPDLVDALAHFMQHDLYGWLAVCAMKGKSQGVEPLQGYAQRVDRAESAHVDSALLSRVMRDLSGILSYHLRLDEALLIATESVSLSRAVVGTEDATDSMAAALQILSVSLSKLNRHEEALSAMRESIDLCHKLEKENPSAFRSRLAISFHNLSVQLAWLDHFEEAIDVGKKAVHLYRNLVREQPSLFQSLLARSLETLSVQLGLMSRDEESLAAAYESFGLYCQCARARPAAFRSDLASSLNNLSLRFAVLNDDKRALEAARLEFDLYRELAKDQPAVFRSGLARSLQALSDRFSALDKNQEALAVAYVSVDMYREFAREQPAVFRCDFAGSLHTLSNRLSKLDQDEEALAAERESMLLYYELAKEQPAPFRSNLANSFETLSLRFSVVGQGELALEGAWESARLYYVLAEEQPTVFRSKLADSLHNISDRLSELNRDEEALAATRDSVDLYREVVKEQPAAFRSSLAYTLHTFSCRLSKLNQTEEALAVAYESVSMYREIAGEDPAVVRPDHANSLNTLSFHLLALGQDDEAVAAAQESVDLYRHLARDKPTTFNPFLGQCLLHLAICLHRQDNGTQEAIFVCREAEELFKALAHEFSSKYSSKWKEAQNLLEELEEAEWETEEEDAEESDSLKGNESSWSQAM